MREGGESGPFEVKPFEVGEAPQSGWQTAQAVVIQMQLLHKDKARVPGGKRKGMLSQWKGERVGGKVG